MTVQDAEDELDDELPWVSVEADNKGFYKPLLASAPVIVLGVVRLAVRLSLGGWHTAGAGVMGLVAAVLGVAFPLLVLVLVLSLRWANCGMRLQDGQLTVRDLWGRRLLDVPAATVTGLHKVRLPIGSASPHRVVIVARGARPLVVDPRIWSAEGLRELFAALDVPTHEDGYVTWDVFRRRFPNAWLPWRRKHYGVFVTLMTLLVLAYIALVVNLGYIL
jgi:hypothetical protein